jgi:hypothetical protein
VGNSGSSAVDIAIRNVFKNDGRENQLSGRVRSALVRADEANVVTSGRIGVELTFGENDQR